MRSARTGLILAAFVLLAGAGVAQETPSSPITVEVQICTAVEERMPVGAGDAFGADVGQVWCWCKVLGATDTTFVKHVWSLDGKEMAVVELPVRSSAWRTWSSKKILPHWTGAWEVKILDADDNVLKGLSFTVSAPATPPTEE